MFYLTLLFFSLLSADLSSIITRWKY